MNFWGYKCLNLLVLWHWSLYYNLRFQLILHDFKHITSTVLVVIFYGKYTTLRKPYHTYADIIMQSMLILVMQIFLVFIYNCPFKSSISYILWTSMCKRWGRGKGRGGEGRKNRWEGGKEGWPETNIYQSKPLKYKEKEGTFFSELERNYESKYIYRRPFTMPVTWYTAGNRHLIGYFLLLSLLSIHNNGTIQPMSKSYPHVIKVPVWFKSSWKF